jgi:hypothetical protein
VHLEKVMRKKTAAKHRRTAVLVPTSAAPPHTKTSGKLRRVRGLDEADIYRINPQLGPYPAELEFVFPFAQTISDRVAPHAEVNAAVRKRRQMGYAKVVVGGAARGERKRRGRSR